MVGELVSKHYSYSKCSAIEEEDYDEDCPGTCVEDDDDSATIGLKTVSSDEDSALTDADTASIASDDDADDNSSEADSDYNYLPYVPIKSLKFYSKDTPPAFTYWKKIRLPIPPTKIIIQIQHVGLNPVDLRLINSYLKHNCGQLGVGREYSGIVLVVGEAMQSEWEEGEEVMGIYWHPRWLKGVCETSIMVDPRIDIVARVPAPISMRDASGALFCLGASYNLLYKLEQRGQLHSESNILIYGGTTSMGLFTIQLLKYYYRIPLDIVVVCSLQGVQQLHTEFPDISDELVFIDYESVTDRSLTRTLIDMVRNRNLLECDAETGAVTSTSFNQGKFTVVIDFIGGYDIIEQADAIVAENGVYVTTVGDTMANYEKDSFHNWGTPGSHARKWFGKILWDFKYERFSFEPTVRSTLENEWVDICVDLLYNQIVRVVVDRVYSWTKIHKALTYLSTGHAHGKVIVDVDTF